MKSIDLNCDVAEGMNNEKELMPFLTSCNIACGLHAGDDRTMEHVIGLAIDHGVAIGAHPSFDDRANFGRREMNLPHEELRILLRDQVAKLKSKTDLLGGKLTYVKPHGALYNMASRSKELSEVIINAILDVDTSLRFMGLSASAMQHASQGRIGFIAEGFADRKYSRANMLMARSEGGLMTDFDQMASQLQSLLLSRLIPTNAGLKPLLVQSICLHGDTPGAVALVARIHELILSMGIKIKAA